MTLRIDHNPTEAFHFNIKSVPPSSGDLILLSCHSLRRMAPDAASEYSELNHRDFCGRIGDILRELALCESVAVDDPRFVFLNRLREAKLEPGYGVILEGCSHEACKKIVLGKREVSDSIHDYFSEIQSNILTGACYVFENTDLMVARSADGVYFDDSRIDLIDVARAAVIEPVAAVERKPRFKVSYPRRDSNE